MTSYDVLVSGSGIVGRALALSLGRLGLQVALRPDTQAPPAEVDVRAYALNAASVALLRSLKVWDALPAHAATPVYDMTIRGDGGEGGVGDERQRGGTLGFSAFEQRVDELAWIVDAPVLERELGSALRFAPHVTSIEPDAEVPATLLALCEGKASATRESLGVRFDRRPYGHTAIAARLSASQAHQGVARQWFRSPDVLALLPFDAPHPGSSYALVWSMPAERAAELLALDGDAFAQALNAATAEEAGELTLASKRAAWPLMLAQADRWCGPGWVLLGDAAHVVHPLAGQGLNLGLADVAALTKVIAERETWRPLGDARLLRRYARERLAPTWAMGRLTDGLLRLFSHPAPIARELRNRGLTLVDHATPVKRWLTARALDS